MVYIRDYIISLDCMRGKCTHTLRTCIFGIPHPYVHPHTHTPGCVQFALLRPVAPPHSLEFLFVLVLFCSLDRPRWTLLYIFIQFCTEDEVGIGGKKIKKKYREIDRWRERYILFRKQRRHNLNQIARFFAWYYYYSYNFV